jgi:hypothetical protein
MNAARINPPIIEVEESTHSDGEVDGIVIPSFSVKRLHIVCRDSRRIVIDLTDEAEKGFVLLIKARCFQVM